MTNLDRTVLIVLLIIGCGLWSYVTLNEPVPKAVTTHKVDGIEYKIVTIETQKFVAYKNKGEYQLVPLK